MRATSPTTRSLLILLLVGVAAAEARVGLGERERADRVSRSSATFVFLRHGHRLDRMPRFDPDNLPPSLWDDILERGYDTPLRPGTEHVPRLQSHRIVASLRKSTPQTASITTPPSFDAIYASPMRRTVATAAIVAHELGIRDITLLNMQCEVMLWIKKGYRQFRSDDRDPTAYDFVSLEEASRIAAQQSNGTVRVHWERDSPKPDLANSYATDVARYRHQAQLLAHKWRNRPSGSRRVLVVAHHDTVFAVSGVRAKLTGFATMAVEFATGDRAKFTLVDSHPGYSDTVFPHPRAR